MLISPIDQNKESGPENQVSRINSPYWTLPVNGGLGAQRSRSFQPTEGVVLRVRDTRMMERRKNLTKFMEPERRKSENRKHDTRWNTESHHIMVIAVERKVGNPEPWKNGDRVSVLPLTRTHLPRPQENISSSDNIEKNIPPLLRRNDENYVVHLSGKSIVKG